jgi:hypothetical protein
MNWKRFRDGYLAGDKFGYYFVRQEFNYAVSANRWVAEYEDGRGGTFRGKGRTTGNPQGYGRLIDAQKACDEISQDIARNLGQL